MDQLTRLEIPFVLIETSKILCCELLKDKVLAIQGDAKRHDILQAAGIELELVQLLVHARIREESMSNFKFENPSA